MLSAIRFSPDGAFALAASKDGFVRLWRTDSVRPHAVFDGKCGLLLDADFSPDGERLILAGSDGTARIWPVDPVGVAERACPMSVASFSFMSRWLDQALLAK
jgi:WD40 repeat protein